MKYLQHACPHCGAALRIETALAVACPTCAAPSGSPCVDQRGPRYRELTSTHRARREIVEETSAGVRKQLATAS